MKRCECAVAVVSRDGTFVFHGVVDATVVAGVECDLLGCDLLGDVVFRENRCCGHRFLVT